MTKDNASSGLSGVQAVLNSTNVQEAWRAFADACVGYGFDQLLYGMAHVTAGRILQDPDELLILHEGPQSYLDVYVGEELYKVSPSYVWASEHSGAASWPEAAIAMAAHFSPEHLKILELNRSHGVNGGYVVSLRGIVPGTFGVIGLSSTKAADQSEIDVMWAEHGEDIETLCRLMHVRISSLPRASLRRPLTSRQREVLAWAARGKTTQDIAQIMGLSMPTVEKHLKAARDALEAQTTTHAVKKATELYLLED